MSAVSWVLGIIVCSFWGPRDNIVCSFLDPTDNCLQFILWMWKLDHSTEQRSTCVDPMVKVLAWSFGGDLCMSKGCIITLLHKVCNHQNMIVGSVT